MDSISVYVHIQKMTIEIQASRENSVSGFTLQQELYLDQSASCTMPVKENTGTLWEKQSEVGHRFGEFGSLGPFI